MHDAWADTARPAAPLARRVAFASPEISITILYATVNSWYLYYLINIAGVPPFLAGIAFAFGRTFDGVVDPFIGRWLDANRKGHGRKRIIRLALLPAALAFVVIWFAPAAADGPALKTVCAAISFAAFALAYSLTNVPRLSMLPRYETDYHGRTAQVGFDMGFHFVSLLVAIAGVPALISLIDGAGDLSGTQARSWWIVTGGLAAIACTAYLPFLLIVPEQHAGGPETQAGILSAFRVPGIPLTLTVFTLSVMSLVSVQSMLPFFLETYVGIPKKAHAPVLGGVLATSLLTLPLWVALARWLGKRKALIAGLLTFGIFLGVASTVEAGSGLTARLFLAAALAGASVAALNVFPWAMVPDTADLYFRKNGRPGEGICTGTFMFFNQIGASLAVFLNGMLLSLAGHVGGRAEQSDTTVDAIYSAMIFAPLLIASLGLIAALALRRAA